VSLRLLPLSFSGKSKISVASRDWSSLRCLYFVFHWPSFSLLLVFLSSISGRAAWCASFGAFKKQALLFSKIVCWDLNLIPSLFLSLLGVLFKVSAFALCCSFAATWKHHWVSIYFSDLLQYLELVPGYWHYFHSTTEMRGAGMGINERQVFHHHLRFELIIKFTNKIHIL